jgi:hypothetical protein
LPKLIYIPYLPIEDGIAERPCRARSAEEEVPNLGGECLCLRVRREADLARPTAERERDRLALRLTRLDVRLHGRLTVRQRRAGEERVIPLTADLRDAYSAQLVRCCDA